MSDQPRTWHYGLVAQWWAEFNEASREELTYYQRFIESDGQSALDLACGTGCLLLPFLRAGLDVDGCDLSPDMLALCRQRAAQDGLPPNRLYRCSSDVGANAGRICSTEVKSSSPYLKEQ
jgi:SAM-dependent methyltransferase